MAELYLEDLAVGRVFTTGVYEITADAVKAFAKQFDPQPFHLDEAAAKASLFGGLAASGWHTAAITMRLIVEGAEKIAGGFIGAGVEQLSWPAPVRPGDRLQVTLEVLDARPSRSRPAQGIARFRMTTRNQAGAAVQTMIASLLVPRQSAT